MSIQSFIETDWDKIVQDAALKKYQSIAVNASVTTAQVGFLKYTDLAKAVSNMEVKGDTLICRSECNTLVKQMWEKEKDLLLSLGAPDQSVVKEILEILVLKAGFKDKKGKDITLLQKTNLLDPKLSTSYFNKTAILSGGGTKKLNWRPGLTRRVRLPL